MFLVGLTGGIASGKSTVAARLVQHGMVLIDADAIARRQLRPETAVSRAVVEQFGRGVLGADGEIDRAALGRVVFGDPARRHVLEAITHPPVIAEIADRLAVLRTSDGPVVVDVPLLVEVGVDRGYESVVVVATHPGTQVGRLVDQRGMTEADARTRVDAQAPLRDKLAHATDVIWNEGSLDELRERTDEVAEELLARARTKAAREATTVPDD